MTDANNVVHTCSFDVTVLGSQASVSLAAVPPAGSANTGGVPTNIYLGYGPQSVSLQPSASGGSGFMYTWNNTANLTSGPNNSQAFSSTTPGQYTRTVTATNSDGCAASASVTLCVRDIKAPKSGRNDRVYMCGPNGTQMVNVGSVPSFLNQGYSLGACNMPQCPTLLQLRSSDPGFGDDQPGIGELAAAVAGLAMNAYPNPSATDFRLVIESTTSEAADLRILDMSGRVMSRMPATPTNVELTLGRDLAPGIYFIEARSGSEVKMMKVVKL